MNLLKNIRIPMCLLALSMTPTLVRAQDPAPAPKAPSSVKADILTDESLKEKLEGLGYKPEIIKSKTGGVMYRLNFDRDNYRFVFNVSLSADKKCLWLSSALRPLPEAKNVRPDILEKILEHSDKIGPTHFSLRHNRYLYLELALNNYDITALRLRTEIDQFTGDIRASEHLWNPAKYPANNAAATTQTPKDKTN
jgi:hypothetical protein